MTAIALALGVGLIGAGVVIAFGIGFPLMRIADEMVLRRAARETEASNGGH